MSRRLYPECRGLSHAAIVVRDLARAERFYAGLLGLRVVRRHDDERGEHRSTWLALDGDAFLAIERTSSSDDPPRADGAPGHHCLALRIRREDRARWLEALEAEGIVVERTSAYSIYFRDPDGALVALSHYPEPAG